MDRFHPPGFLEDFARRPDSAEDRAKAWSAIVSSWMDNTAVTYGTAEVPSLFFNPLKDETPGEPEGAFRPSPRALPWGLPSVPPPRPGVQPRAPGTRARQAEREGNEGGIEEIS